MNPLTVAVTGAGSWGRNHVRTVAALPEASLTVVCELDAARREQVGRQYPSTILTDDPAAAMDVAEAVVVTSSATSHESLALMAIERGLPVLVEKPFTLSVAAAERVVNASIKANVPVVVGHLLLFHPAIERLRALIQDGDLGSVYYLYSQRVNLGQVRPDESALWSFGPHDISVALYLIGERPVQVSAHGHSYLQPGIEDVVFLTMEFASGVMANAQMSWLDPHKERRLTVVGSKRMVVFDDMQPREKLKIFDKSVGAAPEYKSYGESMAVREGDIHVPRISNQEPLSVELKHFVRVARGEEASRTDAQSGLEVVRVLEHATASLKSGGTAMRLT